MLGDISIYIDSNRINLLLTKTNNFAEDLMRKFESTELTISIPT